MPGTYATLISALLYLLLIKLPLALYLTITIILNGLGVWLCGRANRAFGTHDHPAAVWDEIAAFPLVMVAVPFTWYYLLLGIMLFRLFDIWKPGPIGWIDRHMKGGWGVMLDDIAAALLTWILLHGVIWAFS